MTTLPIERFASEQQAEKLEAEAEANEAQADADHEKADAARMKAAGLGEVAQTILNQMGGNRVLAMLGVKRLVDLRNGIGIGWPNRQRSKGNYVEIVLNGRDLYDMTFYNLSTRGKKKVKEFKDLYNDSLADTFEGQTGWYLRMASDKAAAGGLYGYTKGTQRDVEVSIRKAQRRAASVAKTLYAKDNRSFAFLDSHAKRANSKTARLILSAMSSIGPRLAADKTAGSGDRNKAYLDSISSRMKDKILKGIANHYGTTVAVIEGEVTDKDAEALYEYITDRSRMQVYRDMQSGRFASTKMSSLGIEAVQPNLFYISTSDGDTYGPFRRMPEAEDAIDDLMVLDDTFEAVAEKGGAVLKTIINPRMFRLYTPADLARQYRTASLLPVEKAASGEVVKPVREKVAGGLYGYPTKTARLALVACSDLRAYVGEVAYGLHSRRAAKHDRITGFLKMHSRSARCPYSRMILSSYPDGPSSKSAAMPSQSVGAFVGKIDAARSDAGLSMSDEDENDTPQGKSAAAKITDQQYDALRPGNKVYMDLSTGYGSTGGEREFVVGRTTYSKKYDVYSKTLYPVDEEGNPVKRGRAKYTLFKRKSGVSLGHGGMGTVIKSFRTASTSDQMLRKAFVPDSVDGWLEWEVGSVTAASKKASRKVTIEAEDGGHIVYLHGHGRITGLTPPVPLRQAEEIASIVRNYPKNFTAEQIGSELHRSFFASRRA